MTSIWRQFSVTFSVTFGIVIFKMKSSVRKDGAAFMILFLYSAGGSIVASIKKRYLS